MNRIPVDKNAVSSMSVEEIFSAITERQVKALMFHSQLSTLFDFIGLSGFEKMHRHQYICESKTMMKVSRHFIKNHGKLIPENRVESIQEIPSDWYRVTRDNVTPNIISQYANKELTTWIQWESETIEHLSEYAKRLCDLSEMIDYQFISEMIDDVKHELNHAKCIFYKIKATNFSVDYIMDIQNDESIFL